VSAQGIAITYNPAGPSNQQLVVINSAAISFPELNLAGVIQPVTTAKGTVPGLTVYENGFTLGEAELIYGVSGQSSSLSTTNGSPAISLGGIVTFNDIRIGVQDFSVTFGQTVTFGGSIIIGTGGATFLPGKPVSATISPAPGAQALNGIPPVAMQATVTFNSSGQATAFQFFVGQMTVQLSSYVTLTATKFNLNTGAGPTDPIVSFSSVGATVKIGSLSITGSANNFAFLGNGSFETPRLRAWRTPSGRGPAARSVATSCHPINHRITWPDIQGLPRQPLSAGRDQHRGTRHGVTVTGRSGHQVDRPCWRRRVPDHRAELDRRHRQGDLYRGRSTRAHRRHLSSRQRFKVATTPRRARRAPGFLSRARGRLHHRRHGRVPDPARPQPARTARRVRIGQRPGRDPARPRYGPDDQQLRRRRRVLQDAAVDHRPDGAEQSAVRGPDAADGRDVRLLEHPIERHLAGPR
jgi:hypothetical protein